MHKRCGRWRSVRVYISYRTSCLGTWNNSNLVEMRRIELLTPCLQGRCSPSWATPPLGCLSSWLVSVNFSYMVRLSDRRVRRYIRERKRARYGKLVGLSGLEPPTSRLSGVRSNRLSYRPICLFWAFPAQDFLIYSFFNVQCLHTGKWTAFGSCRPFSLSLSLRYFLISECSFA